MTRPWERKTHEYLLVLTMLILVQTGWTFDGKEFRKLKISSNTPHSNGLTGGSYVEIVIGTAADADTLQYYLSRWNDSSAGTIAEDDVTYYGEGLPDVFFHSSAENSSLILTDMTRCMNDFRFVTCLKMLLVNRLDNILDYLNDNNLTKTDFSFGNGMVSFNRVPDANAYERRASDNDEALSLDEDITQKVMELFKDRSLHVNFLPGVGLDVKPVPGKTSREFIGFMARPYLKWQLWRNDDHPEDNQGRSGNKKKRKGGFKMPSMMILPQLIMLGFMPFALANLQAMVMNAFMLNMMALNSAIFMTIRNLVFGPRGGPKIKYVNYGYRKKKKTNVPTIIVHSPAAFVKQPFHHHRKPIHHHHLPPQYDTPLNSPPHYHPSIHRKPIHYHDDSPASFSDGYNAIEPEINNHEEAYDEYQTIDHPELPLHHRIQIHNDVEVFKEEGKLDGKNRVRIRINEGNGSSMKEILHRIRTIENRGRRFKSPMQYEYRDVSQTGGIGYSDTIPSGYDPSSADNTPWTISDHSASHTFSVTHSPQIEGEDYVINYDQNQFTPMRTHPKKAKGH